MNFCKFYNKSLNWIEYIEQKYIEENEQYTPRKPNKEVNIFLGFLWIVICFTIIFLLGALVVGVSKFNRWIKPIITSRCDLEDKQ